MASYDAAAALRGASQLTPLLMVPATGLLLVAFGGDLLPHHVAAQVIFTAVVAGHVGLVLRHTVAHRHRHRHRHLARTL